MSIPTSQQLIEKADAIIIAEGRDSAQSVNKDPIAKVEELILPALVSSKNIQSSLYSYRPTAGSSPIGKVKLFILNKLRNVIIAVLERTIMRQQKVNELTYQTVVELTNMHRELQKELDSLKK